jgi:two-component system cell cycle response regulator DivK
MSKKVLIVEDNELNMKLFHDLLEAHGIGTVQTSNGLEVMEIARRENPDLILMDIQLPEVSGLDVTKWLKADDDLKRIPVIAVTAFAMKGDEEKIREGGCEDYISKPISVSRFIEVIQTYLNKTPAEETEAVPAIDAPAESAPEATRDIATDEPVLEPEQPFEEKKEDLL